MKHVRQFCLILSFSFLGEGLHAMIPLPIPASIYGLLGLFVSLLLRWIKLEQIKETGTFLAGLLTLLFISPVVSLLDCWNRVEQAFLPIVFIIVSSTFLTFGVSGKMTQWLLNSRKKATKNG